MKSLEDLDTQRSTFTKETRVVITESNFNKLVDKVNEIVEYINQIENNNKRVLKDLEDSLAKFQGER
jgi:uncharacterized protein YdcH (DUF465 family)